VADGAGAGGGISNAEREAASCSCLSRARAACQNFGAISMYRSLGQYGKAPVLFYETT
jgi:hypothetical protein